MVNNFYFWVKCPFNYICTVFHIAMGFLGCSGWFLESCLPQVLAIVKVKYYISINQSTHFSGSKQKDTSIMCVSQVIYWDKIDDHPHIIIITGSAVQHTDLHATALPRVLIYKGLLLQLCITLDWRNMRTHWIHSGKCLLSLNTPEIVIALKC